MVHDEQIRRAQAGDKEAFRGLYQSHVSRVRSVLMGLVGAQDLDDLTQEVFVRVWRSLPSFRGEAAFATWLFRIVRNVAMDGRRNLALGRERHAPAEAAESVPCTGRDPDARLLVARALSALSEEARATVVLVDLEDFPLQEAAEILDVPLGTVKSRLHAARRQMRAHLEERRPLESLAAEGGVG